jgi:hypothetical protein
MPVVWRAICILVYGFENEGNSAGEANAPERGGLLRTNAKKFVTVGPSVHGVQNAKT